MIIGIYDYLNHLLRTINQNAEGLNGVLVTQLTGNLQLGHPTQKAVSHIIILLKIFIQVTGRYTPLNI